MTHYFISDEEGKQWLKDTHLLGVTLPVRFQEFGSVVIQGPTDCPYAVNLYRSDNPNLTDGYFRIVFKRELMVYAECQEYPPSADHPYRHMIA